MTDTQDRWLRFSRMSAALGAVVWIALLFVPMPVDRVTALISRLITVGPLIMVPLALGLITPPDPSGWPAKARRAAMVLQLPCAGLAVGSFFAPQGMLGAGLAVPWLVVTGLIALFGLGRIVTRRDLRPLEELCIDSGLLYIPVGGGWWVLSRYGAEPMDFPALIVLLTAAHFHFAGFAAPIIAGFAGRALVDRGPIVSKAWTVAGLAVVAGPPLIAIGITVSPTLEVICAVILAVGLLVLAGLMAFRIGPRARSGLVWLLLTVASLSLVLTMVLACTYAIGEFTGRVLILIPRMAETHGLVNVFGFSLCGMLAMTILHPGPRSAGAADADGAQDKVLAG